MLDLGLAQSNSWGRIIEFDLAALRATSTIVDLGIPRLFDICVLRSGKVLLARHLPRPAGSILIYDYPVSGEPKEIAGFDFPNRIVSHETWDFVICADRVGLHRIPIAEFGL
jgi:hypothetical protein